MGVEPRPARFYATQPAPFHEATMTLSGFRFDAPLRIGALEIPNRVLLAPLAGVSDVPFRRICQELGAGLTYVEMLSATAIRYRNRRTFEMMARHPDEKILGVQVTGPSAAEVEEAVGVLASQGFSTIDINMGCPVRKVVGAGCGSAFLRDQPRLVETVARARAATLLPLSIKYRLGYTREEVNVELTTRNGVLGAVDMVTIHGRTRSEGYDTPVDFAGIRRGVEAGRAAASERVEVPVPVPIVGNGDVFCHASASSLVAATGCDAVMVSRGALGNPWVFSEILAGQPLNPTLAEWLEVVLAHIALHEAHYGKGRTAAVLMRKHLLWYAKGFPGTKALRDAFNVVEDLDDARSRLESFAAKLPSSLKRFASEARMADANAAQSGERTVAAPASAQRGLHAYDPKYEMDREHDRGVGHLEMATEA
jgi:tRNA-dihydrouridine synthase B